MEDYYQKNALHPLIKTTNTSHTKKSLHQLYTPNYYLQASEHEGLAVTGQIAEVRTDPSLHILATIDGRGGRYSCSLPSIQPTGGTGKSLSVPTEGQRFSGILPPNSQHIKINSFHGLLADCGEEGTEKPLKPARPGDTKIKTGGKYAPEISIGEDGTMLQRCGNLASIMVDGKQGKQTSTFKEATLTTHGHTSMRQYQVKDPLLAVPHVANYLFVQEKYKDLNFVSDKFQDTETKLLLPGLAPYIDKVVIRGGYIRGENPIEDLGHIYEIRTQQTHTDG